MWDEATLQERYHEMQLSIFRLNQLYIFFFCGALLSNQPNTTWDTWSVWYLLGWCLRYIGHHAIHHYRELFIPQLLVHLKSLLLYWNSENTSKKQPQPPFSTLPLPCFQKKTWESYLTLTAGVAVWQVGTFKAGEGKWGSCVRIAGVSKMFSFGGRFRGSDLLFFGGVRMVRHFFWFLEGLVEVTKKWWVKVWEREMIERRCMNGNHFEYFVFCGEKKTPHFHSFLWILSWDAPPTVAISGWHETFEKGSRDLC